MSTSFPGSSLKKREEPGNEVAVMYKIYKSLFTSDQLDGSSPCYQRKFS